MKHAALAVIATVLAGTPAWAHSPDDEPGAPRYAEEAPLEERPRLRNPSGAIALSAVLGVGVGDRTSFVAGVGVGYAVVTGVLPGIRGLLIADDGVGGELATTLTLTPPFGGSLTPFVVGETGRRFVPGFAAWFYGVGGGLYLGEPAASVNLQLGYIHRWFVLPSGVTGVGSPIVGVSIRF